MVVYSGNWVNGVTEDFDAALQISFFGEEITLTLGTDGDRSICDVLVDNVFWGSLDTYAATPGELAVTIPLARLGLHVVEIRNRPERNTACVPVSSTSFKLEFKQLETAYDGHAIDYTYDDLSRLLTADYFAAWDDVNPVRDYTFAYDVAGNRTSEVVNVDGSPFSSQTHTYDAANRISSAGFSYNNAGQMTADGTLSYSWDRAGRLLGAGDSSYAYNGLGQRVQQTVSGVVTEYLLDVQPGLAKVIAATTGANTERFVHERGLLSQQDSNGDWQWIVADGLGSVRVQADSDFDVEGSRLFAPFGAPFDEQGAFDVPFAFTGEMLDANGLQYHRARYYNPTLGAFPSLDLLEGVLEQAMSLNRYAYVAGNVINLVDLSGNSPNCQGTCSEEYFTYNRSGAVQYAMNFALQSYPGSLPPGMGSNPAVTYGFSGAIGQTFSAIFISEVMHFGGDLPMTVGVNFDPANPTCSNVGGGNGGWRICDGNSATSNWRGHRQLRAYMEGFLGAVAVPPFGYSDLDDRAATPDHPLWANRGQIRPAAVQDMYDRVVALGLTQIQGGDYLYIDSGNYQDPNCGQGSCRNDDHGYIVVGWGQAIDCATALNSALEETYFDEDYGEAVLRGFSFEDFFLSMDYRQNTVPYVVDHSFSANPDNFGWKQIPRPRPFYCSKYNSQPTDNLQSGYSAFGHNAQHSWYFYHLPNDPIYIPCGRQHQPIP